MKSGISGLPTDVAPAPPSHSALGATMSAAYVAMVGFLGGSAFTGDPLVALLVSLTIGTAIGMVAGVVRRMRPGAAPVASSPASLASKTANLAFGHDRAVPGCRTRGARMSDSACSAG